MDDRIFCWNKSLSSRKTELFVGGEGSRSGDFIDAGARGVIQQSQGRANIHDRGIQHLQHLLGAPQSTRHSGESMSTSRKCDISLHQKAMQASHLNILSDLERVLLVVGVFWKWITFLQNCRATCTSMMSRSLLRLYHF